MTVATPWTSWLMPEILPPPAERTLYHATPSERVPRIRRDGCRSRSFQVFIAGVERAAAAIERQLDEMGVAQGAYVVINGEQQQVAGFLTSRSPESNLLKCVQNHSFLFCQSVAGAAAPG